MDVITIEAMTVSDAIKKIKKKYGSDAVILSSREKSIDGENKKVVEFKIAISSDESRAGASILNSQINKDLYFNVLREKTEGIERRLAFMVDNVASREQLNRVENGLRELKMICNYHMKKSSSSEYQNLSESIYQVEQQLDLVGIDFIYKKEVIDYLRDLPSFNPLKSDQYRNSEAYYRSHAIKFMYKNISVIQPIKGIEGCSSVHIFVGGHGVGKTCTIAKLASILKVKDKKRVLLVSYDYRNLGLQDTLPVYAKILGIEHATIEEADHLKEVVALNRHCEIVLVDTSGGLVKDDQEFKRILKIKDLPLPVDNHLVLSLTENSLHQESMIQKFSPLGIQSFIFTKLDEIWTCGNIYNHINRWSVPVSYFSTGPKVPENIEIATRERVIERIFSL